MFIALRIKYCRIFRPSLDRTILKRAVPLIEKEELCQTPRICINVRLPIADSFMIRTGVIAKEKLKKGQNLKTCPKSGAVQSAEPAQKALNAWVEK
jgi:hypothetical protein